MTIEELPEDLRRFIAGHITSVAHLEILLYLRDSAGTESTVEQISAALRAPDSQILEQLQNIESAGLAEKKPPQSAQPENAVAVPTYAYAPKSPELAGLVDRLADAYAQRRVSVITFIYSKPVDKVRTFADAFRLRRED